MQQDILTNLLYCAYRFVTLLGMLPVRYCWRTATFHTSHWHCAYSLAVLAIFAYGYLTSALVAISAIHPLVAIVFVKLTLVTIAATVCMQCCRNRQLSSILNDAVRLATALDASVCTAGHTGPPLRHLFVKVVLLNAMAQCALIRSLNFLVLALTGSPDYVAIAILSVAYFMQTMVPNMFFAAVLSVHFYLGRLNAAVSHAIATAQRVQNDRRSSVHAKQLAYCRISDRLDRLAELHLELTQLTLRLNAAHSLQLLSCTLNFFGVLVFEVFAGGAFGYCV